tara:strand:- start:9 stop:557 length:549 start_codon:yes stop_codon:yes gene_type:complete
MIQATISDTTSTSFTLSIAWHLNVSDSIVGTPTFTTFDFGGNTFYYITYPYFLFKLESQQTGKIKLFTDEDINYPVGTNINHYDRSILFNFKYSPNPAATEDLVKGEIIVGNSEFPLGFYNMTIYQINSRGELDPNNAEAVLYNGVLNMKGNTFAGAVNFQEVQYTEYNNNDSDNENVYLTN